MRATTILTLAVLGLSVRLSNAQPFVASAVGDSTTVYFSGDGAGGALTAFADLMVVEISSTSLGLFVRLSNTTGAGYTVAGINSFGFGIDPNASVAEGTTTGSNDTGVDADTFGGFGLASMPALPSVEVCAWAGSGCGGGPQRDLLAKGATDFFVITLRWDVPNAIALYILDNFGLGFQTEFGSAYMYGSLASPPGYNTNPGANVLISPDVILPDGTQSTVRLTFDSVDTGGNTSVSTSSTGPPPSSGFKLGTPPVYYEITTTATFTGNVRVCMNWAEGQFNNEANIRLFHQQNSAWVDITDPASLDKGNNTVCGTTTSFSPFALMEVKYPFTGFFQPVDNLPVVNSVKAPSAVPVKFSLGGDLGLDIFAAGYPQARLVQCETGATLDDIEATVTAGGSTLKYDATTAQYTYVWKTETAWAASCRELQVKLTDGEMYSARFSLRR